MRKTSHKLKRVKCPNDLLSKPENVSGVEEVPLATLARALAALRPNDDLILEQSKQLEDLNHRLDVALNNMGRGLSMFDASARLIVCNKLYREIYELPEELTRPATTLADIVRHHGRQAAMIRRNSKSRASGSSTTSQSWHGESRSRIRSSSRAAASSWSATSLSLVADGLIFKRT